jgi:Leucine-rich repeat (LRR) protein
VWDELIVLELRGNLITELPATVNRLGSMRRIFLEMNQIRELPSTVCELKKLTNLYIAFNKLTALPSCIGNLGPTLGDIWLRGNNIPKLPDSFCDLVHLGSAYIMDAGFEQLPTCFGRVGSALPYTHVELENNKLRDLPDSMADMFAEGRVNALNLGECAAALHHCLHDL